MATKPLLDSISRLAPSQPAKPYTVGLNIIDSNTINGAGGVYFLSQMTSGRGNGNQAQTSYFTPADDTLGDGYYDIEGGSTYYEIPYQPIPTI